MSRTLWILLGSLGVMLSGYVGSYFMIRKPSRPVTSEPTAFYTIRIREACCVFIEGHYEGTWAFPVSREDETIPIADSDTDGFYLSYVFAPLWRLEAWLAHD